MVKFSYFNNGSTDQCIENDTLLFILDIAPGFEITLGNIIITGAHVQTVVHFKGLQRVIGSRLRNKPEVTMSGKSTSVHMASVSTLEQRTKKTSEKVPTPGKELTGGGIRYFASDQGTFQF